MTEAPAPSPSRPGLDLAAIAIALVGIQQGLVPLALRLIVGYQERFALATYLPSPWWWITCLAVMVAAATLLAIVDTDRTRDGTVAFSTSVRTGRPRPEARDIPQAVSGLVFLVGVYNGVLPFVVRLFDTQLLLVLPSRLPAPWWWLVSLAVCVATAVVLWSLDHARSRSSGDD